MSASPTPIMQVTVKSLRGGRQKQSLDTYFDFSRQLAATNAIDLLLEIIVRFSKSILDIRQCQVLVLGSDGSFVFTSGDPTPKTPEEAKIDWMRQSEVISTLQRALFQHESKMITKENENISLGEKNLIKWQNVSAIALVPLVHNNNPIGMLVIGDTQFKISHVLDGHSNQKLYLWFAEQAASALYRAQLKNENNLSQYETVLALSKTVEARNLYTGGHSQKMADLVEKICLRMGVSAEDTQTIRWAAMLHDIGKIGIPDEILLKPAALSLDEWKIMHRHPEIGAEIILKVSNLTSVATLVLAHHERFDGTGYPRHLKGEEIPIGARILAVVDAFCAITEGRVYHQAHTQDYALRELSACSGTDFDPQVVAVMKKCIE